MDTSNTQTSKAKHINQEDFENEIAQGYTFVDVWAPWCGPCLMLGPIVDELAGEWEGQVKVVKLNADESAEITDKFGIQNIPTMLLFKDGKLIDRLIGALPKASIAQFVNQNLAD
jgi:thioredoxin 1